MLSTAFASYPTGWDAKNIPLMAAPETAVIESYLIWSAGKFLTRPDKTPA